ncbi:MAG TPA: hypothetical protein VFW65_12245 [Pseudonocardiaceae bacterium]|nr:hypothetical protein [Pseudonocardiaceae bacterium]
MQTDSSSTPDALLNAATAYLPSIGSLDIEAAEQANDDGGAAARLAAERAAAARAVRESTRPDLAFLQQVLDGLRRM